MNAIKTAWDQPGIERWTAEDQRKFDAKFRAWAKRTGNQTKAERDAELGIDEFSRSRHRRRAARTTG
jgi:hypothetical protein